MCLSPVLAGSLRDAIVAHVIGNMEDEGLNSMKKTMKMKDWILYSISLPRASYFWLSLWKIVEATLWAWTGLRKRT